MSLLRYRPFPSRFFHFYFILFSPFLFKGRSRVLSCLVSSDPPLEISRLGPSVSLLLFSTRSTILIRLPFLSLSSPLVGWVMLSLVTLASKSVRTGCCTLSWNSSTFFFSSFIEYCSRWKDQNGRRIVQVVWWIGRILLLEQAWKKAPWGINGRSKLRRQ